MKFQAIFLLGIVVLAACSDSGKKEKTGSAKEILINEQNANTAVVNLNEHPGYKVYANTCLPCHQADGNGVPGMFPTLHKTKWVDGDNADLIEIVIHGMDEEIEIKGQYFNLPMAAIPELSDQQVSDVLNYVRKKYGSSETLITPEEVSKIRN